MSTMLIGAMTFSKTTFSIITLRLNCDTQNNEHVISIECHYADCLRSNAFSYCDPECRYAVCHHAECRGAMLIAVFHWHLDILQNVTRHNDTQHDNEKCDIRH